VSDPAATLCLLAACEAVCGGALLQRDGDAVSTAAVDPGKVVPLDFSHRMLNYVHALVHDIGGATLRSNEIEAWLRGGARGQ
jgi:3D (Asp-Asp-Asp) domain-containing protein